MTTKLTLAPAFAALALLAAVPLASAAGMPQPTAQRQPAPRVLLFPFSPIHLSDDNAWMTKSVQENLLTTLSDAFSPTAYAGKLVVEDNQAAARNARQTNFPYAIRGSIQIVDTQVRLTAQLVDSRNGNSVRTAIATGPATDLLKIEDDLSAQLLGQARGGTAATADNQASANGPGQPPIQIFIQNTPSASPSLAEPANYPYSYAGYSNYGYGSPFVPGYYPGVVVISDNHGGHHGHDHDHDHDGHGDDNGGGGGIHFETSGPQNGPNTPGTPMSPGGINSDPDYHPTYTRPPLPGPTGGAVNHAFTPAPAAAPAPSAGPTRVGTTDPRR